MLIGTEPETQHISGTFAVRGGLARPRDLIAGTRSHTRMDGVSGISVQCWPGVSIAELAKGGDFPNAQISVATYDDMRHAGFKILLLTPGRGCCHAIVILPVPLPMDVAVRLSALFVRQVNPYPAKLGVF